MFAVIVYGVLFVLFVIAEFRMIFGSGTTALGYISVNLGFTALAFALAFAFRFERNFKGLFAAGTAFALLVCAVSYFDDGPAALVMPPLATSVVLLLGIAAGFPESK